MPEPRWKEPFPIGFPGGQVGHWVLPETLATPRSVGHHIAEYGNADDRLAKDMNPPAINMDTVAGGLRDILLAGGVAFTAIVQIGIDQPEPAGVTFD